MLMDDGIITEEEFQTGKKSLLSAPVPHPPHPPSAPLPPSSRPPPPYDSAVSTAAFAADGDDVYNHVMPAHSDDLYDWSAGGAAAATDYSDLYGEMSPANDDEDASYLDTAPGIGRGYAHTDASLGSNDRACLDTSPGPPARGNDSMAIKIGARCTVETLGKGYVRFVGPIGVRAGNDWVGVELDDATGKHDGSTGGFRGFVCATGHGVYVKASKLQF